MNGPREEQTAALQVTRFDHIVINCRDVDITAAWYERVLGMSRETFGPAARTALTFGMQRSTCGPSRQHRTSGSPASRRRPALTTCVSSPVPHPPKYARISRRAESRSSRAR